MTTELKPGDKVLVVAEVVQDYSSDLVHVCCGTDEMIVPLPSVITGPVYRVPRLVWKRDDIGPLERWEARGTGTRYAVEQQPECGFMYRSCELWYDCDSIDHGKELCERHYQECAAKGLEPVII
jgi:hypothetical protein